MITLLFEFILLGLIGGLIAAISSVRCKQVFNV